MGALRLCSDPLGEVGLSFAVEAPREPSWALDPSAGDGDEGLSLLACLLVSSAFGPVGFEDDAPLALELPAALDPPALDDFDPSTLVMALEPALALVAAELAALEPAFELALELPGVAALDDAPAFAVLDRSAA